MVTRGTPLDVSNYLGIEVPHKKQKIMVSSVVTLHARVVTLHTRVVTLHARVVTLHTRVVTLHAAQVGLSYHQ